MDIEKIKELVANDSLRIELYDLIVENLKQLISELESEHFSTNTEWSEKEFKKRISKVEKLTDDLSSIQVLLSYWGSKEQKQNYLLALRRLANVNIKLHGRVIWIFLRWYPIVLLFYYSGVSAVAGNNYQKLFELVNQIVISPTQSQNKVTLIQAITKALSSPNGDPFELVCENKNLSAPRSEYLSKLLQVKINDLLFLNSEYESTFDRFEVLLAIEYAHQTTGESPDRVWGPVGRFAYTHYSSQPLNLIINEAENFRSSWAPIKAGFFGGDYKRFKMISNKFKERIRLVY